MCILVYIIIHPTFGRPPAFYEKKNIDAICDYRKYFSLQGPNTLRIIFSVFIYSKAHFMCSFTAKLKANLSNSLFKLHLSSIHFEQKLSSSSVSHLPCSCQKSLCMIKYQLQSVLPRTAYSLCTIYIRQVAFMFTKIDGLSS